MYLQGSGNPPPKIFNSQSFSKWKVYKILVQTPYIKDFLPYTELYHNPERLLYFLEKHGPTFLKPSKGFPKKFRTRKRH
ncbi:YheC/YheD family protein [Mesobacillus harenae]|uniref:YheC/YheD family protein n=1 Tax=Mesobacillus harenae TaxID=2213203 RepID=UPI003BAE5C31